MGGPTGCDIVLFGRIIVREFVGQSGRVGDGNGVDGDDGDDGNGVILEVTCMGVGSVCSSHMMLVVLYKRDRKGSDVSDPLKFGRVFQISSLRYQSRLE